MLYDDEDERYWNAKRYDMLDDEGFEGPLRAYLVTSFYTFVIVIAVICVLFAR